MLVQQQIQQTLDQQFQPEVLEVVNESHMHSVPPNSETHFKVVVVTSAFDGQRKVGRHQQVYAALAEQLAGPVHALALHTYTPQEWSAKQQPAPDSPDCLGGSSQGAG
ncbi:BolA family protein [Pseudohalioglobus lutimaris]|uniref:DNA-binding transcriptional regulator BolA n=1 Tax=Pseudohalioglobus lutimaris TaxID=1737061 RepID=A0A2N5WXM9_9GAMM|nr:BolA/IbaG family iron-sulfur metabolism protein [Pseudohalioglobus lutimaris]PLW66994.1 BolA family transcriptional regulator [Pseudohalioglobus lutimaris]